MRRRFAAAAAALLVALLAGAPAFAAKRQKVDTVFLANGDRITGEILSLTFGSLQVSTDNMGTVSIEWIAVASVESPQLFRLHDEDEREYVTTLAKAEQPRVVRVDVVGGSAEMPLERIARLEQIETNWWHSFRGSIDLGFSYTSADDSASGSFDLQLTQTRRRRRFNSVLSYYARQENKRLVDTKSTATAVFEWQIAGPWFWLTGGGVERNDELDLKLRATVGGGIGRYLLRSPRSVLTAAVGLSANHEQYNSVADDESGWNQEAQAGMRYELFLYGGHDTRISSQLWYRPSFTTSGRYRIDFDASFRRKLMRDFTLAFTFEQSHDSAPPSLGSEKTDRRFKTTLGWTF